MNIFLKIILFCLLSLSSLSKEDAKSKSQIEIIIEEYLLKNPEILIKSLENYRIKQEAEVEKIIKSKVWPPNYKDVIFMFQKELGEKIIAKYPSSNYGRLSILTNYRFNIFTKNN